MGTTTVHVDNKGIIDGLFGGEMKCTGPTAKDADFWILMWEEVRRVHQEGMVLEVERVKAHRTKAKQEMTLFQNIVTEGNERVGELAKDGGGDVADKEQHSAQKRGGPRGTAVRSELS